MTELSVNREKIHQNIFFGLLVLVAIGMQFSHFLVSISIILLSANYLAEGKYISKLKAIWSRKSIMLFVGLFMLHVIGLLWSTDLDFGVGDIQRKLPLLAIPIVFGTSKKISRKQFEWALLFFLLTSTLSSLNGLRIYFGNSMPGDDYRLMSPFLSHIRLSLMMGVAVFSSIYLSVRSVQWAKYKWVFVAWAFWFVAFLLMLRAMSGIVAFGLALVFLFWRYSNQIKSTLSLSIKLIIVGSVLGISSYVYWQVQQFYEITEIHLDEVDQYTLDGEKYEFNVTIPAVENGNYVFSFIAPIELEKAWNKRSHLDYNGNDFRGQELNVVLIRYLTSKGLRKDRQAIESLSDKDVWAVENGLANVRFLNSKSLNTIIYGYIWEIHNFAHGLNPQGNSFGQRLLFWQIGNQIIMENWSIGVGTGDVQLSFNKKYDALLFEIIEKYQLRAHNQYITMAITFGVFGLIYFLITLFSGLYQKPNSDTYLFLGFFILLMISMLDEDTLETQFGVTFATYFYFLFLFQQPEINKTKIN